MKWSRSRIRLWLEILFVALVPLLLLSPLLRLLTTNGSLYIALFFALLFLRALALLRFMKLLLKWFHGKYIAQKQDGQPESKTANRALLGTSLLMLFLLLELVFMFVPQTQDVYKMGLANKVWNLYYREPENEKRFRDKPLAGRMETKKDIILFLGDSYTYGNGIRHNRERFPDMVYAQMDSSKFEAFNLGRGNTDTRDEYLRLLDFGRKPDYLILQYYHNDIEKTGATYGYFNSSQTGYKSKKPSVVKKVAMFLGLIPIECSFFLNYTAFNSAGFFFKKAGNDYKECLTKAYSDTSCVSEHLRDVDAIIRYSEKNQVKLRVLFIPDARDIDFTQGLFDRHIIPFLKARGVRYITLDKPFRKHQASELIINPLNAHTNPFANAIIAEQILDSIPELRH
jgi:hypothetical protein